MNNTLQNLSATSLLQSNPLINKIIVAIIIFFVGLIIGRILGKLVERVLREFHVDKTMKTKMGLGTSMQKLISGIVSYSIYFVFAIIALNYIGITSLLLNILSIIVILILFISAILSLKDALPNILSFSQVSKNIKQGDIITIKSVEGKVKDMNLFATIVVTKNGDEIRIPNVLFLKETHIKRAKKK
ncbi:mechanosensitive ion channel family protein [Candidatus Woesearchaeota archaeon]|nr:mechanosensitive ion channel family protein [Candidatus Woesearchaeota archaeon]